MFYSHTFLARKSPLGTVWIAAHLQHKLRKSQVAITDIPKTVDSIMFPEVPIALRLSGHLLLGVVRIYSKKVDYLYQDCNDISTRIATFASSKEVNLPEEARCAQSQDITLPLTFDLDSMELDDDLLLGGIMDNNLRTQEEITITDQVPVEGDPYVAFFLNEDIDIERFPPEGIPEFGPTPMEMDTSSVQVENVVGVSEAGQSSRSAETTQRLSDDNVLPEPEIMREAGQSSRSAETTQRLSDDNVLPETEVMRDVVHDFNSDNILGITDQYNVSDQQSPLEHNINRENISPMGQDMPISGGQSAEFQLLSNPTTVAAEMSLPHSRSNASLGGVSTEMAVQPTPQVENRRPKLRKRKQYFDQPIVLSNLIIRASLNNTSNLRCKRNKLPTSALDCWKFNNRSKKDNVFNERTISGLSPILQAMFDKEFISSKFHKTSVDEPVNERTPTRMPDPDMEIEIPRGEEHHADNYPRHVFVPSPSGREETPTFPTGPEPQSEVVETEAIPTFEETPLTQQVDLETEAQTFQSEEQIGLQETGFSDIPESRSPEAEDLRFLEADTTPTAGNGENEEVGSLSVRTRAVAQYLQKQSPAPGMLEDQSADLSLNKILEGKSRKQCARMFFETLVLKSHGLVEVKQDEPYGDITLSATSTLAKATL